MNQPTDDQSGGSVPLTPIVGLMAESQIAAGQDLGVADNMEHATNHMVIESGSLQWPRRGGSQAYQFIFA